MFARQVEERPLQTPHRPQTGAPRPPRAENRRRLRGQVDKNVRVSMLMLPQRRRQRKAHATTRLWLFFFFWVGSNTVRKSIARVLTVINQKQRQNLREYYKGQKYLPLDLRYKKTRAIRRRLTPVSLQFLFYLVSIFFGAPDANNCLSPSPSRQHERSLKTEKQRKKDIHFPLRKYAVKA